METGDGWLVTEICLGPLEWLHPLYANTTVASWKRETVGQVLKSAYGLSTGRIFCLAS
jgi:hypothetical protein